VSQTKANRKILKVAKFGLHKLKPFFNIQRFIGSGVNLTPASRRRVKLVKLYKSQVVACYTSI